MGVVQPLPLGVGVGAQLRQALVALDEVTVVPGAELVDPSTLGLQGDLASAGRGRRGGEVLAQRRGLCGVRVGEVLGAGKPILERSDPALGAVLRALRLGAASPTADSRIARGRATGMRGHGHLRSSTGYVASHLTIAQDLAGG